MKFKFLAAAALSVTLLACQTGDAKVELKTTQDKVSYSIGLDIGRNFERQGIEVSSAILAAGIKDGLTGAEAKMTDDEIRDTMMAFRQEMMEKQTKGQEKQGSKNKEEGAKFLAANKTKDGVKTTESGLQYRVINSGKGKTPTAEDSVVVHYTGRLVDGTVFDSSVERGEPVNFPVSGVIPGWTEALQLMKEGDKWELVIPAALAYGDRGAGPQIAPHATLIFETELLEVQKGN
jgi:FKBP-type peptidyl-prolyl cis-trans isomerase FklB